MEKESVQAKEVWKSLYELIEASKETDRQMRQTDQKIDKLTKDIDKLINENDKQIKENDKRSRDIDKLQKLVGGISNSNGFYAEESFYKSFSKNMSIGNMKFQFIDRNMERTHNGLKDEFDIVLTNSDSQVIIEVKYNFHPNDVKSVVKKIANFRRLFPIYKNYKIFGAIAGLTMPQKSIEMAKKYGFYVLTHEGQHLKILNDEVIEYSTINK